MPRTKLLICDANVIIDMEKGSLIKQMFRMPYQFAVPDVLYEEELKDSHSTLPKLGLKQCEVHPDSVSYAIELVARYKKPGRIDLLTLAVAKQEQCRLLTGDHALREAARGEGVEVVGTLWLVSENVAWQNYQQAVGVHRLQQDEGIGPPLAVGRGG